MYLGGHLQPQVYRCGFERSPYTLAVSSWCLPTDKPSDDESSSRRRHEERRLRSVSPPPAKIELCLTTEESQLRTARLFVAAVARHVALPEDTVEDLKLAVSEAATSVVIDNRSDALRVSIELGDPLTVKVFEFDHTRLDQPFGGIDLILALFPRSRLETDAEGSSLLAIKVEEPTQ